MRPPAPPRSRRSFLKTAGLAAAATCAGRVAGGRWAAPSAPNILLVAVDDLRDWTGFLGTHPQVRTPHLDRLARRGLVFTRNYCCAPACGPSRTALFTGLAPSSTGVYENGQSWPEGLRRRRTLTRALMEAGYYVAGSGKLYHGEGDLPLFHARGPQGYRESYPVPDRGPGRLGAPLDVPDEALLDHQRVDWCLDLLRQPLAEPLFLACGVVRPHLPWDVPRRYFDLFDPSTLELPPLFENDLADLPLIGRRIAAGRKEGDLPALHEEIVARGEWRENVRAYLASIAFADAQVGRLLSAWESSPHAANGLVVLWGDHGWHLGEKHHWSKFTLWEEATRCPLVLAGRGIPAGTVCHRPVSLLDLYPTLAHLAGLTDLPDLDGQSLVPLIRRPDLPWERGAVTTHGRGNHAVRTDRWRYIHYRDGGQELYDHRDDPHEWHNRAEDPALAQVRNELHRLLPRADAPEAPFSGGRHSFFEEQEG